MEKLEQHLQQWASTHHVHMRWMNGVLRLENPDGTANAVLHFDAGFWEAYERAATERQDEALLIVQSDVQMMWPRDWYSQEAKIIDVPLSYLRDD